MFHFKKQESIKRLLSFISIGITMLFLVGCNIEDPDEGVNETNNGDSDLNYEEETQRETQLTEANTDDWEVETLAENLEIPWAIEIHEGTIYMTDRDGHILELGEESIEKVQLQTSSPIAHVGEGGLLGFVLSEDFEDSFKGYAYYTFEGENGTLKNRVITVIKEEEGWVETNILLDDIPGAAIHNGGRLAIGPDDLLYVTTGDADNPDLSQDEESLAGKILRMTVDGDIPADNPFDDSYVYSYGHRNPQGLAWNDEGELYSSEHGPTAQDEINLIEPNRNYGWPVIEGNETEEGMEPPLIHSGDDTWAPSGIAFLDGHLLVAGLRGENLYLYDEDANEMIVVYEGEGRLRDVKVEDEYIYLLTNNTDGRGIPADNDDRVLRLTLREK